MSQYWPENEISTRNCYNCLVGGHLVHCRKGRNMQSPKYGFQLTYRGVMRDNRLLSPCINCGNFDNTWEDENERKNPRDK